ncbi:MAG: recombinase family protein [Firmicutes bacterium]|nr:recombinase family protein [Bacillota bacterium]
MLEKYAKDNGFKNCEHFPDDGVSGTVFSRPELNRLLDLVRQDMVATVIIKDQSRIGRDVLEVGLLKREFEEQRVTEFARRGRAKFTEAIRSEKDKAYLIPASCIHTNIHGYFRLTRRHRLHRGCSVPCADPSVPLQWPQSRRGKRFRCSVE